MVSPLTQTENIAALATWVTRVHCADAGWAKRETRTNTRPIDRILALSSGRGCPAAADAAMRSEATSVPALDEGDGHPNLANPARLVGSSVTGWEPPGQRRRLSMRAQLAHSISGSWT